MSNKLKDIKKIVAELEANDDYYDLINYLEELAITPENAYFVRYKLGVTHGNRDEHKQASPHLEWLEKQDVKRDAILEYNLAKAYLEKEEYDKAFTLVSKSIQLDPKLKGNYRVRGQYYEKMWYYTNDKKYYQLAYDDYAYHKKLAPKKVRAILWMAQLQVQLLEYDFDEALYENTLHLLKEYEDNNGYSWHKREAENQLKEIKKEVDAAAQNKPIEVKTFKSDWHSYDDVLNEMLCHVKVDKGLQDVCPSDQFPLQIWLSVGLGNTEQQEDQSIKIDDTLIQAIESNLTQKLEVGKYAYYAGYIKQGELLNFYFYTKPTRNLQRKIDQALYPFQPLSAEWEENTASAWLDYTEFMVPS